MNDIFTIFNLKHGYLIYYFSKYKYFLEFKIERNINEWNETILPRLAYFYYFDFMLNTVFDNPIKMIEIGAENYEIEIQRYQS